MIYYFSGSITETMMDLLSNIPGYEPIDSLVSQLDRGSIKKVIELKKQGLVNRLFIDSGAYSFHTGRAKLDVDEYIDYLNSIDDYIEVCAQVDTIPGKFGQPKSREDYEESAKKSWDNYLYMRDKLKSPKKLTPVFHYGESEAALKRMLDWTDSNGDHIDYIGVSPANDSSQSTKNTYMASVYDIIKHSSNPNVKTHLYGMTSLDALSKYPCYSADSVSHRLLTGYAKIVSYNFGVVSVSKRSRTSKVKSNQSFLDVSDDYNLDVLKKEIEDMGFTLEEIQESVAHRVAVTMFNIQRLMKDKYVYKEENRKTSRKLFSIGG